MSRDLKSPLLKKRALDSLLDSMADGLDGHDNYDELGAHRRGESTPEQKGTEFDPLEGNGFAPSTVIIPPKDLAPPSGPADAEFFKESEPKFSAEETLPSKDEIVRILHQHPLVGLKEKPRRVFVIGSVARGEQRPDSDIDILLEVDGGGQELTEFYRRKLQQYFVSNDLHGKHDEVHPQWNGRRVDVYTTSNADSDDRPKVKIGAVLSAPSKEFDLGTLPVEEMVKRVQQKDAAVAPIEEEIEEHEFYKEAPKTAGHRVKDTGDYDEQREAKVRKIAQETAQYYERGAQFDPKGEYQCKGCHYMLGNKACAFVEGDIDKENGTCRYWKVADGKAPVELERKYNKQDAGYAVRKDKPFGCSRCEYGFKAAEADSSGRDMWCEFFGMHIEANACCNNNSLHGDITYNSDNSVNKQGSFVSVADLAKTAAKTLYHVTSTAKVPSIKAKGILPLQESNWVKGPDGERYGEGEIFAMDNAADAVRWAAKMDWEFNKKMGSGKISIIVFTPGKEKWKVDSSDPLSQSQNKGRWLKAIGSIKPEQIVSSHVLEPEMVKSVVQGGDVKFSNEKTADVPTKSYGMGTPIGGTDNPDAGAEDDPVEGAEAEAGMDMTSSLDDEWEYDPYDYEAEDARLAALDDEAELESEILAHKTASEIDSLELPAALGKIGSYEHGSWFSKSARPSEQKVELMTKQFKITPEQMELVIATDPSPNQSDYVGWIAKWVSKGGIILPEDTDKIKGQLEKFQKFKKSPAFTFDKDLQKYDPAKLFETLQSAEAAGMGSKKEKQRDTVRTGADLVVNEGDIKVYEVTTPEAAVELGSGTNWCTANRGMAGTYLAKGPLYIFFDAGSAVAQLQPESNAFMNRQDVCILENVRGESGEGYYSRYDSNAEKFLADPAMAKALGMLAGKRPKIKEWVEEHIASPEKVLEILTEESGKEIQKNKQFDESVVQYEKDKGEYQQKLDEYNKQMEAWNQTPAMVEYNRKLEEYKKKEEEYYRLRNEYYSTGKGQHPEVPQRDFNRYDKPEGEPEQPHEPSDPRNTGYSSRGYGRGYGENRQHYNKKYVYQVRNALATSKALPPEIEADLVGKDVGLDLLIKYGSMFHPGQDWAPLREAIFKKVEKGIGNTGWATEEGKYAVDYCAKFIKGPWPELEPLLFTKMFLQHRGMENMMLAIDYAIRGRRVRWPEFEEKLQKAKPSQAAGYGAAEYAIRVLKKAWTDPTLGIKKKRTGKTNQEELMIVGNPGEARKYAEAFFQGQRWTAFEESAMKAQHYKALINYAGDTLKKRWPELEAEILEGKKDSADQKGGRRRRWHQDAEGSDLALAYAKKVVKGRWPEYEAKMLPYVGSDTIKGGGYGSSDKYEPSHGEYSHSHNRLPDKIANYVTQVVQGRWPELEQSLLGRYQQHPNAWITSQNLIDGYCSTLSKVCQDRYKDNGEVPEPAGNEVPEKAEGNYGRRERPNKNIQKSYTKFQQDAQCYWAEGEKRLVTRDEGYEAHLVEELKARTTPKTEREEQNWGKGEKYVKFEDMAAMERPQGEIDYKEQEKKPSYTIWNGIWIGWYGMDELERYVDYMLDNGQEWKLGVDIMEIAEDLEDIRGRRSFGAQRKHRRPEQKAEQKAKDEAAVMEQTRQMHGLSPTPATASYKSALLKKKALIEMHESPSMLPPRDDISSHMDKQMQDQLKKDVMEGVREPLNPKKKKHRPQISPLVNPSGMTAAEEDKDFAMMGKVGPFYRIDTMRYDDVAAFHGKRFADAVKAGKKVTVYRAGKPGEQLKPGTFLSADKNMALSYQHDSTDSFGGPEMYRYEVDPKDLLHVENFQESELVYKPRAKKADYTQQDWEQDEASELWLDQVRESEDEAKRHFMEEDYIKQIAQDDGVTMDQLWDDMGEEYTAEFYGYPYKTVTDFTDAETRGMEEEEEKPVGINGKVSASVAGDGTSRVYVLFHDKEMDFADPLAALQYAKGMSAEFPGDTALFVIDEEGVVTEDTFINGKHIGETVEKFAFQDDK